MIKSKLLATAFALVAFAFTSAQGSDIPKGMEKCKVNDTALIKDKAKNPDSVIVVPTGECDKINHGDFSGLSEDIKAQLNIEGEVKSEVN